MVVFKENYDLTRRTPTPPAQRRHRETQNRRQEDRTRHVAFRRGQFEAKRRLTQYIESQRAHGGDTRQLPTLRGNQHHDHELEFPEQVDDRRFSGTPSDPFSQGANRDEENPATIHPHPFHYTLPSAAAVIAGGEVRTPLQRMQSGVSFVTSVANGGGNTASIRGGAGFLSLQNSERRVHPWTLDAPAVSNDSFSGFLGPQVEVVLSQTHNSARNAVSDMNELVNNFPQSNYYPSSKQPQQRGNNSNHSEEKKFSLSEFAARRFSDDVLSNEGGNNNNNNRHNQSQNYNSNNRLFASNYNQRSSNNNNNLNDETFNPPCGFDTLEKPNDLFAEEKRISGEDHFERYNFAKSADEIRVATTVKEFKRLVVDKPNITSNLGSGRQQQQHVPTKFAAPGGGRSFNSNTREVDPSDQQNIVEGLLGTHQRSAAPSNVELEAIRILREIASSNNNKNNNLTNQQQQQQQKNSIDSYSLSPRKPEADDLTKRLAAGVTESKRRQNRNLDESNNNNNNNSMTTRRSPMTDSPFTVNNNNNNQYVSPASTAVPRPPPDYYKKCVSGRGIREARIIEEEKIKVAAELMKKQEVDPNPLSHRPPFRLKGAKMGTNNTKASLEEQELEDDIREDIRLFEWRKAAQEDAKQRAKVAVVREKQIDTFRQRQAEHFREALSRFEPGALQRAEKAIQHRIAHELVQKYGAAQFLSNATTTRDVVIPTSYQVCAREAAVAAAEAARNEKMIQRHKIQQEQQKMVEDMHFVLSSKRADSSSASRTARPASSKDDRSNNKNHYNNSQSPGRRDSSAAATIPPHQGDSSTKKKARPETAGTVSFRDQTFIHNRTHIIATQGLPKQKKEYVPRDAVESSGYKSWGGSVFPRGVGASETEEHNDFVASAKTLQREIEEMEARCPSLALERIAKQQLLANGNLNNTLNKSDVVGRGK